MRILVIEDVEKQRKTLRETLLDHYGPAVQVDVASTEAEFYTWFDNMVTGPVPDIAIIDIMLPWTLPRSEDFTAGREPPRPPPDHPMNEAGFRCARRLRSSPLTENVPLIFYTAFPPDIVDKLMVEFPDAIHKRKDGDYPALFERIDEQLGKNRA
ncbi:MAG: hypothetical protein ABT940_07910 [Alphaproteobacteria bacterium]